MKNSQNLNLENSPMNFHNEKFITFNSFKRHNYKIGWIILPIIIVFLLTITISRFTIIGIIIDDIFSFPFGLGKYILYAFILFQCFVNFAGFKCKFSRKAKISLFLFFITILWILSNLTMIFYIKDGEFPMWSPSLFKNALQKYWNFWYLNSIFIALDPFKLFGLWPENFWLIGGGLIGITIASLMSILTFPVNFILASVFLFIIFLWIFNAFKLFSHKKQKQSIVSPLPVVQAPIIPELTEQEKKFKIHHHDLKNANIIDDFVILNLDDEQFKSEKEIRISNIPHSANTPKSIMEEIIETDEYSPYTSEQFALDEDDYEFDNTKSTKNDNYQSDNNNNNNFITTKPAYYSENEIQDNEANDLDDEMAIEDHDDLYFDNETIDDEDNQNEDIEDEQDNQNEDSEDEQDNFSLNKMNNYIDENIFIDLDRHEYVLPPFELLATKKVNTKTNNINWNYANLQSKKIIDVFNQFNVLASIQSINVGPQATKFEILPEPGTKVKKIISLEYDLKLALATSSLRIESPIPGKSFIGLEIPNKNIEIITFIEMMENIPIKYHNEKLLVGIGKTVENEFMYLKINDLPHLLISGTTGSGKSICIKSIISSLIMHANPSELKLVLIDPKRVELKIFLDLPHLLCPIIYDYQKAIRVLKLITKEMERRYNFFSEHNVNNIDSYNILNKNSPLPKIVIVIDELADLMMISKNEVEESIMRITQMARAAGIYLIIATQRPSTDVVTGIIKTNIPSRISFYLSSGIDSRTILDSYGAEKLISKGDMLYNGIGQNTLLRMQGVYISDEEINRLVTWWKKQRNYSFNANVMNYLNNDNSNITNVSSYKDPLYDEIKKFIMQNGKASISLLQRHFAIGYIRASKIIDMLEANHIIGPQNGSKPRSIYNELNGDNEMEFIKNPDYE